MSDEAAALDLRRQEKSILDDLQQHLQPEVPQDIQSFLGRLGLLYGVPFGNLVPDARMLPPESIRFFYVDSNWLEALIDGAFSIGVHSERDIRYHKVMQHAVREAAAEAAGTLRAKLREERTPDQQSSPPAGPEEEPGVRAGFLLRSAIVSGWPGLEICGYASPNEADDKKKLELLRLERLAPDVLLCIFKDIPELVVINEPSEDFHFGLSGNTLRLRNPKTGERLNRGDRDGGYVVPIPMRSDEAESGLVVEGVLDVKALHTAIGNRLTRLKADGVIELDLGQARANFAVQMIDAADKQAFRLPAHEGSGE